MITIYPPLPFMVEGHHRDCASIRYPMRGFPDPHPGDPCTCLGPLLVETVAIVATTGHTSGEVEGCSDPFGREDGTWCDACWAEAWDMLRPGSGWDCSVRARAALDALGFQLELAPDLSDSLDTEGLLTGKDGAA